MFLFVFIKYYVLNYLSQNPISCLPSHAITITIGEGFFSVTRTRGDTSRVTIQMIGYVC